MVRAEAGDSLMERAACRPVRDGCAPATARSRVVARGADPPLFRCPLVVLEGPPACKSPELLGSVSLGPAE